LIQGVRYRNITSQLVILGLLKFRYKITTKNIYHLLKICLWITKRILLYITQTINWTSQFQVAGTRTTYQLKTKVLISWICLRYPVIMWFRQRRGCDRLKQSIWISQLQNQNQFDRKFIQSYRLGLKMLKCSRRN
jgi:hypothetical protein